jgi:hypothetical protein
MGSLFEDKLTVGRNIRLRLRLRTGEIREDRSGNEIREGTSSAKNQKTKRERRRTSLVASPVRRDFRVIAVVIVNELPNKQHHLIRNPFIYLSRNPEHVTIIITMTWCSSYCSEKAIYLLR